MRIKVCGLTRMEDVVRAAALGVDAIGFVLWPRSPRAVAIDALSTLLDAVPPLVTTVGVFVDPTTADLERARQAGVHVAQVHGVAPTPPVGMPVLRAVHLADHGDAIVPAVPDALPVLLDAFDPVRRGGTGQTLDWERAAVVARRRPVILAGGLTPANVGRAIRTVQPYGVDVSSGVETSPGVKNHDEMAAFVAAVRSHA